MKDERLKFLLDDMLLAATEAVSFVEGLSETEFENHAMAKRATTMCVLSIGEAAGKLAIHHADFVLAHPELPIAEMRGMRNRIAHGYSSINFHTVWHTVKHDLPQLIAVLEDLSR